MRGFFAALCALAVAAPAMAAPSKCTLTKYLDLPVQLIGRRAIVTTHIGGKEARFILDSGAFYSVMSRASAVEFGLPLSDAPPNFYLRGINGQTSVEIATVRQFEMGGASVPHVQFLVGGTDIGSVGVLGQNFLSMFDVEYDFPHGMVRLLRISGCQGVNAAYWAGDKPVVMLPLAPRSPPLKVDTIATVTLNATKLRAIFDTGAQGSSLTLSAARRAGLTPDSPGVARAGFSTGFGSKSLQAWIGTFDRIDIGGEAIPHPRLRFEDSDLGDGDMLIGFDFFLTHHIFVLNSADRMLITYEGGSPFGLNDAHAVDASGARIDTAGKEDAAPTDAAGFARRGAVLASSGKLDAAIADFDSAVALAPSDPHGLKLRAQAHLANHQPLLALADFEKVIALDPADPEPRLGRATLRLGARDPRGALEDLQAADKALAPSSEARLRLAGLQINAEDYAGAIVNIDLWLKFHAEDAQRPTALNDRCWARALSNRELDKGLQDCNAALRARPNTPAFLDSRALVELRRGDWAQARADYDVAIAAMPRNALALYARGLVRRKLGDGAGADSDRAAALDAGPLVAERARRLGLDN